MRLAFCGVVDDGEVEGMAFSSFFLLCSSYADWLLISKNNEEEAEEGFLGWVSVMMV